MQTTEDKGASKIIEIRCKDCGSYKLLQYGQGYFQEHHYFYCPKCFKLQRYSLKRYSLKGDKPILNKTLAKRIRKCRSCHNELKSLRLKFIPLSHDVEGPAGMHCWKCGSKEITYDVLGFWDPFL